MATCAPLREAVGVIMKNMTQDSRLKSDRVVFILAGYEDKMKSFMSMNKGLFRRFREPVHFKDYTPLQLSEIMIGLIRKQGFSYDRAINWTEFFESLPPSYISMFNGAIWSRAFSKLKDSMSNRIAFSNVTREDLFVITHQDYNNALEALKAESKISLEVNSKQDKETQTDE